jgi:hypothetical protein
MSVHDTKEKEVIVENHLGKNYKVMVWETGSGVLVGILGIVMFMTGLDNNNACKIVRRQKDKKPDFFKGVPMRKFNGDGQRMHEVLTGEKCFNMANFLPKKYKKNAMKNLAGGAPKMFLEDDPVHAMMERDGLANLMFTEFSDEEEDTGGEDDVMVTNEETEAERVVREMKADDRLRRIKTEDEANEERKADRERKIKAEDRMIKAEDEDRERKIKAEDDAKEEKKAETERRIKGEDEAKEISKEEKEEAKEEKKAAKVVQEAEKAEHDQGKGERDAAAIRKINEEIETSAERRMAHKNKYAKLDAEVRALQIQERQDSYRVQMDLATTEEEKTELTEMLKVRISDIVNNRVSESSTDRLISSRGLTDTDGSVSVTMEHVMAKAAIAETKKKVQKESDERVRAEKDAAAESKKRAREESDKAARAEKEVLKAQKTHAAEEKKKAAAETKRLKDEQKELDRKIRAYDAQFQLSGGNTSANKCYRY